MRHISQHLLALIVLTGCNVIAPFDPADQPIRGDAAHEDGDDGGPDASPDGDLDGDAPCQPDCSDRACGPDGCGGVCAPGCELGEVCIGCPPGASGCPSPYRCADPAPDQWIFLRTNTTFTAGSPESEPFRETNEAQREVTLTYDLVMSSTELTQETITILLSGRNPSYFGDLGEGESCGQSCPVEQLTWVDAASAVNALSVLADLPECYRCEDGDGQRSCDLDERYASPQRCPGYRLPTEAEWEFAARAETSTATYRGDLVEDMTPEELAGLLDPIAWWDGNAEGSTHPVGATAPNPWGLYDMLGNVFEWCHDYFADVVDDELSQDPFGPLEGSRRVYRGGAWAESAGGLRAARRLGASPDRRDFIGLRPVRTVQRGR